MAVHPRPRRRGELRGEPRRQRPAGRRRPAARRRRRRRRAARPPPPGRRGHPDRGSPVPRQRRGRGTLAIRSGDPTALAFYTDRGRVHTGDLTTAADQAFDAWVTDRDAGLETHPARPDPRARRRAQRPRPGPPARHRAPRRPASRSGSCAAAGRQPLSRRRHRHHPPEPAHGPARPHRLGQERRPVDRRAGPRRRIRSGSGTSGCGGPSTCPATTSPAAHLQLGYATTVHGAQGVTVDTAHTVLTGGEDRRLLYVALTRGRAANHLYVATAGTGDPHEVIRPESLRPPSTLDQLHEILARDGATDSATSTHAKPRGNPAAAARSRRPLPRRPHHRGRAPPPARHRRRARHARRRPRAGSRHRPDRCAARGPRSAPTSPCRPTTATTPSCCCTPPPHKHR